MANETGIPPVKAVIFDMDGLILDTETIYTEVTQAIVGRFGKVFDWSIKSNMIGRKSEDSAKYLVSALDLPISPETYLSEREHLMRLKSPYCKPLLGAKRLIARLHEISIPLAVATSSNRELFEIKTSNHQQLFRLFDLVVTGDDPEIANGKPAPDIFILAAKRLGITPKDCLVFEDAPSGLHAGIAAGMRVVVVPDVNMDKSRYTGATQILSSLEDFDPVEFGLPGH